MPDQNEILRFLKTVFGDEAPGYLILWVKQGKKTIPVQADKLELAASIVYQESRRADIYVAMGLHAVPPPPGERGTADKVIAIPGLWMDIDIKGPGHASTHLPQSLEEVLEFLKVLRYQPTMIVHTGGGVQCHFLFKTLWIFKNDEERAEAQLMSRTFQHYIIEEGGKRGWELDNTASLGSILRPAGSSNRKLNEPRPCSILKNNNEI